MEIEKINKETRIKLYDLHYGFLENPKAFDFDLDPHRLIVRNYALRNHDKETYEKYLAAFYPDRAVEELEQFSVDQKALKQYDFEEAKTWLRKHKVRILKSDINYTDQDAIFSIEHVGDDEDIAQYLTDDDGFVLNNIEPEDVLKTHVKIWLSNNVSQ